ncbi:hypothetical protein [Haloechinothrix salitolerans]|uniref:DUF4287 domain-containing protein n=1 Tax=Haloechinothrix salitolerans TaxID=926830 RepID=A0ABW2BTM7_9PSEU
MTTQKSFKRRVRARMAKTGESYTAARRHLLPEQEPAAPDSATSTTSSTDTARRAVHINNDESIRRNTGRGWAEWFALLDEWGARDRSHTEIARWIGEQHNVSGWWAQSITVGYEQERGLRQPGQQCDGYFAANASKTIAAPLAVAYAAIADAGQRGQWLGDTLTPHGKSRENKVFRAVLDGEPGKVEFLFTAKGEAKTQVAVSHTKLTDADTAAKLKQRWRERLAELKAALEG